MSDATNAPTYRKTRVVSLGVLAAFLSGIGYAGRQAYEVATDSFVAPAMLSPDSDLVLSSKLALGQLVVERDRTAAELESTAAAIQAGEEALVRMDGLKKTLEGALDWTSALTHQQKHGGEKEMRSLASQQSMLKQMVDRQRRLTEETKRNLEAGLVSQSDLTRERQTLNQLELALLENRRTQAQSSLLLRQAKMASRSLSSEKGAPATPEMVAREDQMIHIELERLKLDADLRAKKSEEVVGRDKLTKMNELVAQMKTRPIFRATEHPVDVAFVPYTQMNGVLAGAEVRACVWGIFSCTRVGTVRELVPGEVILPDPWGNQARGQYAILDLADKSAMQNKLLRVRGEKPMPTSHTPAGTAVAQAN